MVTDDPGIISGYFPSITESQTSLFNALGPIYERINRQINLISRNDIHHFYERHVLHSLAISKLVEFPPGSRVMDLGTGGGFPGIPLAILFTDTEFFLVDSIRKKTEAVQGVINELNLNNVQVINRRAEDLDVGFDFVVSRATASLQKLVSWSIPLIRRSGDSVDGLPQLWALKGGALDEELAKVDLPVTVSELSAFFDGDFYFSKKIIGVSV